MRSIERRRSRIAVRAFSSAVMRIFGELSRKARRQSDEGRKQDRCMDGINIRFATRDDLTGLLMLYRHLHPDDPALDAATAECVWETLIGSALMSVVVAELERRIVASCTLAIIPNLTRGGRSHGVIENVVTHAEHRRMGLGRQVLAYALDVARKAGCYKVCLATGSQRESTLRFYEGAGFERGGKTYFEMRERNDGA